METQSLVKRKYARSIEPLLRYLCRNPQKNLPVIVEVTKEFYVMQYVQGRALSEILKEGCLPEEEAKNYILQLLDAVEVLHRFQIVHRDIKPENIIIKPDGTLVLIDFDIARKFAYDKKRDTEYLGSAGYAAPEQYGFTQSDERTDIYAVGAVYNQMLSGAFPTERLADGYTGKIIARCTAIDSGKRYGNVKLLRKDVLRGRFTPCSFLDKIPGVRSRNPVLTVLFCLGIFNLIYSNIATLGGEPGFANTIGGVCLHTVYTGVAFAFLMLLFDDRIVDRTPMPLLKRRWEKRLVSLVLCFFASVACAWIFFFGSEYVSTFRECVRLSPVWYFLLRVPFCDFYGIFP